MSGLATPVVKIGGVDKTTLCSQIRAGYRTNGVGAASFTITDPTGAFIPADRALVEIDMDGSNVWSGELLAATITFLGITGGVSIACSAQDNNRFPQRALVNRTFTTQTEKAILQSLVANPSGELYPFGTTLDASQATGDTIQQFTAADWTVESLLNYLFQLSGRVWAINAANVLRSWAIGDRVSGVTIALGSGNFVDGNWTRRGYDYRNQEWVIYGQSGTQAWATWTFVGDGVTTSWAVPYVVDQMPASYTWNGSTYVWGLTGPLAYTDNGGGSFTITTRGGFSTLTSSDTISAPYLVTYPQRAFTQDSGEVSAHGPWTKADSNTGLTTYAQAVTWGNALIASNIPRPKLGNPIVTLDRVNIGETVAVSLSPISLSETCFANAVDVDYQDNGLYTLPVYSLTLFGGIEKQGTAYDMWRNLLTGASGSSSVGSGGGSGGGIVGVLPVIALGGRDDASLGDASFGDVFGVIPYIASASFTGRLRCMAWARDAGITATVQLWDVTAGAAVATATTTTQTAHTAITPQLCTITSGHEYRLQRKSSSAGHGVYASAGVLEVT